MFTKKLMDLGSIPSISTTKKMPHVSGASSNCGGGVVCTERSRRGVNWIALTHLSVMNRSAGRQASLDFWTELDGAPCDVLGSYGRAASRL